MGDGGDELGLHLVVLADLLGHLVDGGGQLPDLIIVFRLDLDPVAAGCNAFGCLGDAGHGLNDGADKVQVGHIHHGHCGQTDSQGDEDEQQELLIGRGVNIERNTPLFQTILHQLGHIDGMSAKQKIEVIGK